MNTMITIGNFKLAAFGLLLASTVIILAGEPPPLGKTKEIEITESLKKHGSGRVYEFSQVVEQGDKLRVHVWPTGRAVLKSKIRVLEDGKRTRAFEDSHVGEKHDWTMTKGIPGRKVTVQIVGYSLGTLNIMVEKADQPKSPSK